jgi:hypothetical protein
MSDSQAQPWTDENLEAHVRDTLAFQREIGWPWMTETQKRAPRDYADIWVCVDCYFAHHYGAHEHEGQWYAGESDIPSDRKPLGMIDDERHLADNTDSETGEGIDSFSMSRCDGCGSSLGGERYRLAVFA